MCSSPFVFASFCREAPCSADSQHFLNDYEAVKNRVRAFLLFLCDLAVCALWLFAKPCSHGWKRCLSHPFVQAAVFLDASPLRGCTFPSLLHKDGGLRLKGCKLVAEVRNLAGYFVH